eukprot:UN10314
MKRRLLKMVWPLFQNGSTAFSKLYCRLLKMVWDGRLLKMGRPSFQNRSAAFSKWIVWSAFENDSTAF